MGVGGGWGVGNAQGRTLEALAVAWEALACLAPAGLHPAVPEA